MALPSVFGEIPGYREGHEFRSRAEVRLAGLHRHNQNGISGNPEEGADAIVVSGGYADDDQGVRIIYTGEGGQNEDRTRHVEDQQMDGGNLALVRSEERGLPVRVIRGVPRRKRNRSAYTPASGLRYDGLYTVVRHWSEPHPDGPLVFRYLLEKADGGTAWEARPGAGTTSRPAGDQAPSRTQSVTQRVVRNSAVTQWVKNLHDHTCQVCGIRLEVDGGAYAEGAHIRALGRPHNGPDVIDNVLCLCPNDHVLFDKGAIFIGEDWKVHRTADRSVLASLRTRPGHDVDMAAVAYHRQFFAGVR
ncbi:YDG/SRA domain-containing protein [Geodermatophilus sp. CPCC 205506]|uniref:YDG/SRA domain-containing protein n=1 Tax=Geodermatophilus sp. CPCC 205506 TaxID=2936596 RepID=UPI003EE917F7